MPEKIGGGGELEEFSPNDGKYVADGKPNEYYKNPEKVFNFINDSIKNEQYKKMILKFLNKFHPQITINKWINVANSGSGTIIEMNSEDDAYIFFHELGHTIDCAYKEKYSFLSTTFTDEENKRIISYMIQDIKENNDKIFDDYNLHLNEELAKEFANKGYEWVSPKEKERKFNQDLDNEKKEVLEKISEMKMKAHYLMKGKTEEEQKEIINGDVFQKMQAEFDELIKKAKELEEKKFDSSTLYSPEEDEIHFEVLKRISQEYGNISDAVESLTGAVVGSYGHGSGYWDNDTRQEEFFANCFQSIVMEDEQEIEKYKKYFPRAFNIVNKILNKILEKQQVEELYGL